jgi:ABC-2 type transport system permease protein
MTPAFPERVELANSLRGALRALRWGGARYAVAGAIALGSVLAFAAGSAFGTAAFLDAASAALPQLPEVSPAFLVERLLHASFLSAGFLLLLGALTTGVSTLFLSAELPALLVLPIPHARIFRRQLLRTVAASSAPMLLLALPVLGVAAVRAPRPVLAFGAGLAGLSAVALAAGVTGSAGALLLVRLVPPRRALILSAFVSAIGLSSALIGFRGARPERLFDPVEALGLLRALGGTPPSPPRADPAAHVARAVTQALFGEPRGLAASAAFLLASIALLFTVAGLLSGSHLRALEGARTSGGRPARPVRPRPVGSLDGALARAEAVSLLRDASTPAQLGSLLAVFVLHVLNLGVLPAADAATRDVLAGLQAGLALFLVSALSLRFCYPAVSADGRAALVLRTLPLSPARHLLHRYALRAVPATLAGLILAAASVAVLAPVPPVALSALAVTVLGALSLPALHVGLGALFPRYDAPNAVAVALGPGGLFALVLSTALSLGAAVAVSGELRLLLGSLAGVRLAAWPVLLGWGAAAAALGAVPVALGARSLSRSDLAGG